MKFFIVLAAAANFTVYDATQLDEFQPTFAEFQIPEIKVIYMRDFWDPALPENQVDYCRVDVDRVRQLAIQHRGHERVVLDIEPDAEGCRKSWDVNDPATREQAIELYKTVVQTWKSANTTTRIGMYGWPLSAFHYAKSSLGYGFDRHESWFQYMAVEMALTEVTQHLDDLYPSAYYMWDYMDIFERGIQIQMASATNVHRKPVYFFTWHRGMRYNGSPDRCYLRAPAYRHMVDTVHQSGAAGMVLWAWREQEAGLQTTLSLPDCGLEPTDARSTDYQLRWMRNSNWNSQYATSRWMYQLRDFLRDLQTSQMAAN